nr:hypothetical protein [Tanacetum cinerariifolium]
LIEEEMTDKEVKSTTRKFATNVQANYYSGITSIKMNRKNAYELKGKLLDDLQNNAFGETNGEDVDKLRVVVFPISLVGDAWRWFDGVKGSITSWEYDNEHKDDGRHELCGNETHELPVGNIRRFEMIKYSFGDDEEYVAIKEDGYDDLTSTSKDACRAYQDIFRIMDEGWMVTS